MDNHSREFQVFAKPVGPKCNMGCTYCYYLEKEQLFPEGAAFRMPEILLEEYIVQHIEASTEQV
ncbi:MAG: anaerobic sulfatase maturase, partial [Bacteroidales bacterium]|nr:anaerobic sulfatase maturase [Bacteroidales bacterium]